MGEDQMGTAGSFRAVLVSDGMGLGWAVVALPFAPAERWAAMVRLRVRGTISGPAGEVNFRTSLFSFAGGGFFVPVTRAMQAGAGLRMGMEGALTVEPDPEPRPAELPEELEVLLEGEPGLREFYEGLSEAWRREIGKWCAGANGGEARRRRAGQMAERLLLTMEAEGELPPVLEVAFRARPRARAGWAQMTAVQRRTEVFAVFGYAGVEARERRIAKLCNVAEGRLGR